MGTFDNVNLYNVLYKNSGRILQIAPIRQRQNSRDIDIVRDEMVGEFVQASVVVLI